MSPQPAMNAPATLLSTLLLLGSQAEGGQEPEARPAARVERRVAAMGTLLALEVEARDRATALAASESALRAVEAVERRLSTWGQDSELARLNRAPLYVPHPLGGELRADLERALHWWRATDGAFDPGVGGLVDAWGLRVGGRLPSSAELLAARAASGLRHLRLDGSAATRLHPGLRIEEGGFGKGVGLDAALAALAAAGASAATLDLGGQIALLPREARAHLAVAHPRERGRALVEIAIERGSLATSGNGERGVVVAGERLGHLLDPRDGRPAPDFGSLTVWAPNATDADCLSTGLYVLGPDAALSWASAHEGVEVLVVELLAGGPRARASAGLRGRARALEASTTLDFLSPIPPADEPEERNERDERDGERAFK